MVGNWDCISWDSRLQTTYLTMPTLRTEKFVIFFVRTNILYSQCYNFSVVVKRMPIFCLKLTVDVTMMLHHGI